MAEIISDGTRSVTSDDTSARDYSRGYGYGGHDWPERTAERVRGQMHEDTQWANELGRDITHGIADLNTTVEKVGAGGIVATERVGAALSNQLRENSNIGRTDALSFANQGRTDLFQAQTQILKDACDKAAAAQLTMEKTHAAAMLAIQVSTSATNLAIEKTAAAAQLEAERNRNSLATQLAECCCELKELIRAENGATREKMDANRIRELELELARKPGNS